MRTYQISQDVNNPNYVIIDLTFDTQAQAEALLNGMRQVWSRVEGTIMTNPQARIMKVMESREVS